MEHRIEISYSWGDEEEDIVCNSLEEAWDKAKVLAMKEVEESNKSTGREIGMFINKELKLILLRYPTEETCIYMVS